MPDISMCQQSNCRVRNNCYRYRAIPSEFRQSYIVFESTPIECTHHWPISDKGEEYYAPLRSIADVDAETQAGTKES